MSLFRQEVFEAQRKKLHGDVILVQPLSLKLIALMAVIIGSILLTFAGTREYTRKERASNTLTLGSSIKLTVSNAKGDYRPALLTPFFRAATAKRYASSSPCW